MSIKLSVCVEMIFTDRPFLDRLDGVAAAGLPAFEFWRLSGKDVEGIRARMDRLGLTCAAFAGSGGVPLVDSGRRAEFLASLRDAIKVARELSCKTLIVTTGNTLPDR